MMHPSTGCALESIAAAMEAGEFESPTEFGRSRARSASTALRMVARWQVRADEIRESELALLRALAPQPGAGTAVAVQATGHGVGTADSQPEDARTLRLRDELCRRLREEPPGTHGRALQHRVAEQYAHHARLLQALLA